MIHLCYQTDVIYTKEKTNIKLTIPQNEYLVSDITELLEYNFHIIKIPIMLNYQIVKGIYFGLGTSINFITDVEDFTYEMSSSEATIELIHSIDGKVNSYQIDLKAKLGFLNKTDFGTFGYEIALNFGITKYGIEDQISYFVDDPPDWRNCILEIGLFILL